MHGLLRATVCATCFLIITPLPAATVFRCEDSRGKITFTLHGCPSDQNLQLQDAYNPSPGVDRPVPMANSMKSAKPRPVSILTVVGEKQDGCGNQVTGSARRSAIIRQQIQSGMTRQDVESALGKPQRTTIQNGQIRYYYKDVNGSSRQISFDEAGCVRSKR